MREKNIIIYTIKRKPKVFSKSINISNKIKGFGELLLQTFFSFSISYHIRKISILLETLINTRKIKGSECGSKSRQIRLFISYHITKISICLQTLINTRKIKGSIFLNKSNKSKIFFLHIRDENNHPQTIVNSAFQRFLLSIIR